MDWSLEMVRLLLEAGADPWGSTSEGRTPELFLFSKKVHTEMIRLLLEAGADPTAEHARGETALERVRRHRSAGQSEAEAIELTRKALGER